MAKPYLIFKAQTVFITLKSVLQMEVFLTTNLLDVETVQKLNGYTKETANGKKHFLETAEIS